MGDRVDILGRVLGAREVLAAFTEELERGVHPDRWAGAGMEELEGIYREIEASGSSRYLSVVANGGGEKGAVVKELFAVFEKLADAGVDPMYQRTVRLLDTTPSAWHDFPADLMKVARLADIYGVYQFDSDMIPLMQSLSAEEKEEIFEVDALCRANQGRLESWARLHATDKEDRRLFFFSRLIFELRNG